ncbi:T9SS type A sorting domain-containing protein [Halpernia sp.]|uniref:T9SS type A sorting domain-containing protein n=1 Tax=Halpernia sp. TaxID=2782209 RepID=UPI003A8E196C
MDIHSYLGYGQAEDYSVKITSTLAVTDLPQVKGAVVYSKSENKLTIVNSSNNKGFGDYEVYDISGKTVQKGNAKDNVILKRSLPKGTYIIKYQHTSQKFINQ